MYIYIYSYTIYRHYSVYLINTTLSIYIYNAEQARPGKVR